MDSGRVRVIRKSKALEAPVESIAPSTTGKYLFIAFRQCQAPELWLIESDPKLLRKFPKVRFYVCNLSARARINFENPNEDSKYENEKRLILR